MKLIKSFFEWLSAAKIEVCAFSCLAVFGYFVVQRVSVETEKITEMFRQTNEAIMAVPEKVESLERVYSSLNQRTDKIENGISEILERIQKLEADKRER